MPEYFNLFVGEHHGYVRALMKNAAKCTSQRLKWTSGARIMIRLQIVRGLEVEGRGLDKRAQIGRGWTRLGRGLDPWKRDADGSG